MKISVLKKVVVALVVTTILSACKAKTQPTTDANTNQNNTKVLLNELDFSKRPFISLVPHSTNRLFTFYAENISSAQKASLDIEYQSGDLLKGVNANLETPIPNEYIKAIILGSCSTGGKCTFDKDLKSGTTKLKLQYQGDNVIQLLKGDFTFILGQSNLPDGKVAFKASKQNLKDNIIMMDSFGLPKPTDKEVVLYPLIFSSTTDKNISGDLTITAPTATNAYIYDGQSYQPLSSTISDGVFKISLNQKPWSTTAEITRDDDHGNKESVTLYIVGPIILTK